MSNERFFRISVETPEEAKRNVAQEWFDCYESLEKMGIQPLKDWPEFGNRVWIERELQRQGVSSIKRQDILSLLDFLHNVPSPDKDAVEPQKRVHIGKFSWRKGGRPSPPTSTIDYYLERKIVGTSSFPWKIENILDNVFRIKTEQISTSPEPVEIELPTSESFVFENQLHTDETIEETSVSMKSGVEYPLMPGALQQM